MMIRPRFHLIWLWLAANLLGNLLIGLTDWQTQQARFSQDSSIAHRLLSQKSAQQEAVLATLAQLNVPPASHNLLAGLQGVMPQLQQLHYLPQEANRLPFALRHDWQQARQQGKTVVRPAERHRLWLIHPGGWAMQIDVRRWLAAPDWPAELGEVSLQLPQGQSLLLARPAAKLLTLDAFELQKPLLIGDQAFTFQSQGRYQLSNWPWWQSLLLALLSTLGLLAWHHRHQARRQQQLAQEQLRLAHQHRLGSLGEMAAGMAHELNQPLTAILANVRAAERLLDDEDERDSVRHALRTSASQARRAADIVGRLRNMIGQTGAGQIKAMPLAPLLQSLLDLQQHELTAKGIAISWLDDAPDCQVMADAVALEQILHNLVQNAAQALGTRGGHIHLHGSRQGRHYRLCVSDDGPGIAETVLPQLFQPFFTTREGGLGLGLSLAETLAHGMHASLTAANLPAGGACFTLTLPLADATEPTTT